MAIGSSTSILGPNIPTSTKETFSSHLASYNMWALQGESGRARTPLLRQGRRWFLSTGEKSDCPVFPLLLR